MPDHDWRDPSAYEYLSSLSPAGISFEFLRRNPDYRSEFQNVLTADASSAGSEALPVGPDPRWGLSFLDRSRHSRGRSTRILVAACTRLNRYSRTRARYPLSIRARSTGG